MSDHFFSNRSVALAPDDTANATMPGGPCRGLWIGVGGTLNYIPASQNARADADPTAVATTVPAGLFPIAVKRVNITGTAATGIVALF